MEKVFATRLTWATGGSFDAIVKITNDGWGEVYDKADGLYCGSLNPIRTKKLWEAAKA